MSSTDSYLERLYTLFEKHHPGKYTKDYITVILEQNKGTEYECYKSFCKNVRYINSIIYKL